MFLRWGGQGCRVAPVVTLPFLRLHPRRPPRWGLHGACSPWARSCGSFRTLVPLPPHPAAVSSGGGLPPATVFPLAPSPSPRCPRLFPWWVWEVGAGGGAPSLPFLRRKHNAGTALARGTALVLLLGCAARCVAPVFALPTLCALPRSPPRWGQLGACAFGARLSRTLSPLPPHRAALSSGGGAAVRPSIPASPTLGGAEAWGGGGLSFSLRCSRVAGTRRGSRPSAGGGGFASRLPSSPLLPYARSPGGPPAGACTARALYGHGRVARPAPFYLCLPILPRCPRGGGALFAPPPTCIPALGEAVVLGGGGALFASPPLHARRRHDVGTTQPRGEALGCSRRGGGVSLWAFPPCSMVQAPHSRITSRCCPLGGSRHVSAWCSVSRAFSLLCPYLLEEVRTRVDSEDEEVRAAGRTYRTPRRLLAPSAALVEGRAPVSAPNSPGGPTAHPLPGDCVSTSERPDTGAVVSVRWKWRLQSGRALSSPGSLPPPSAMEAPEVLWQRRGEADGGFICGIPWPPN